LTEIKYHNYPPLAGVAQSAGGGQMQERIAAALERIADSLDQMRTAQQRQIEDMRAQNNPEKIKEVTEQITKMFTGGLKHGN
jgi:hypothetical protein